MIQHETFDMRTKIRWQLLQKNFRPDIGTGEENLESLLHTHSIVTPEAELGGCSGSFKGDGPKLTCWDVP